VAGVKLSMHSLRKGFGCHHANKVSAHVLQKLMRHSTIATTLRYYANVEAAIFGTGDSEQKSKCNK
jgi:integrase